MLKRLDCKVLILPIEIDGGFLREKATIHLLQKGGLADDFYYLKLQFICRFRDGELVSLQFLQRHDF
jgi:hypothetical protein